MARRIAHLMVSIALLAAAASACGTYGTVAILHA